MELKKILSLIVNHHDIHARWLNTLSYLENCGARKIAACEHPTLVKEEMLKHAAEEFRHAHYLKKQIEKFSAPLLSYKLSELLGGRASLHYLSHLDLKTSRYLREQGLHGNHLKEAAYLLVTYAIELRAEKLYPLYEEILKKVKAKVAVKSILLEEKEHLKEMQEGIEKLERGKEYAKKVCDIESAIYSHWLAAIEKDLYSFQFNGTHWD